MRFGWNLVLTRMACLTACQTCVVGLLNHQRKTALKRKIMHLKIKIVLEFPGGLAGESRVSTAVVQLQSLVQELPHALGAAGKKARGSHCGAAETNPA